MVAQDVLPPPCFHLAGVPRLTRAGVSLRAGSRNALLLALWLLLEGPTRRDRLAALLWPAADAGARRRNLRRDVFRLRGLGLALDEDAAGALALRGPGIEWPAPAARPPAWLDGLDAGLGGELDEWLLLQREQLQRRWLAHLADEARAREAAGDEAAALAGWQALLGEGAAGPDDAEALREVSRLRRLVGLAGAASGASHDEPSRVTPPAWGARAPLVGRESALAAVLAALDAGRRVYLDGAAGVGKTRLALEAAARRGGALLARCRPDDAATPLSSAARVLQAFGDDELGTLPAWVQRELAGWAMRPPETTATPEDLADNPGVAPAQALARMARAYEAALAALARDGFGAIVLDDFQWADPASLALWQAADALHGGEGSGTGAARLPMLLVHRVAELPPAVLEDRRRRVDRGEAIALALAPLDAAATLALVRKLSHTDQGEHFAARLHHATGGNVLFLLETLHHLIGQGLIAVDAGGRWSTPFDSITHDYAELPLPATVRDAVLARVRALGPAVRRTLEAASLAGDPFGAALLAPAAALPALAAAQALEHAQAAGLVDADDEGRFHFSHDLLAQAVRDALSTARRQALHAELAASLEAAGGEPGRVARHWAQAGRAEAAARWHHAAGQAARRLSALPEAVQAFDAALALATDLELRVSCQLDRARVLQDLARNPEVLPALDLALGDAAQLSPLRCLEVLVARLRFVGEQTGALDDALALADRIRRDPALDTTLGARLDEAQAAVLTRHGRLDESLPLLERALAHLPGSALATRVALLSSYGRALRWAGRHDAARAPWQEQVQLCEALRLPARQAVALVQLGTLLIEFGPHEEGVAMLRRAAELARASGSVVALRAALVTMANTEFHAGRAAAALEAIRQAEQAAPFWDNPEVRHVCLEGRFYAHFLLGDAAALRAQAGPLLAASRTLGVPYHRLSSLRLVMSAHLLLDALDEVEPLLHEARSVLGASENFALHGAAVAAREAEWLRRRGDAPGAWALATRWLDGAVSLNADGRAELVAVAAEAAVDRGDAAAAAGCLASCDTLDGIPLDSQVRLATARLRCAAAGEGDLAAAQAAALAWLDDTRLPVLEGRGLRRALEALRPV